MPHGVQLRDLGHVEELQRFMWRGHSLPNPISLNQNFSGGGAVHAVARSGRLQRRPVSDACADDSADPVVINKRLAELTVRPPWLS